MAPDERNAIEEQLSAYLDGQLSEEDRAALERQLVENPAMRRTMRELESTVQLVQGLPIEPSPAGLREDTLGMLERDMLFAPVGREHAAITERPRLAGRWLATAAVVAMASTAGFFTIRQMRTNEGGPPPAGTAIVMRDAPDSPLDEAPDARPRAREELKDQTRAVFDERMEKAAPAAESTLSLGESSRQLRTAGIPVESEETDRAILEPRSLAAELQIAMVAPDDAPTSLLKTESFRRDFSDAPPPAVDEADNAHVDSSKAGEQAHRPSSSSQVAGAALTSPDQAAKLFFSAKAVPPPTRVQVEIGTEQPAKMYAMVARAKSFAATEKLQVVPSAKEKNREANEAVGGTIAPESSFRERSEPVANHQRIILRARRSQLVRLLKELRLQDPGSVILVATGDGIVTGWESTVAFAAGAGGIADRLEGTRGQKTSRAFPLYAQTDVGRDGKLAGASKEKQNAAGPEPARKEMPERQARGKAGQKTPTPAAAGRSSPSWVDDLVGILGQAEQSLDPDPMTEVHLTIHVLTVEDPKRPPQFDDAPEMGLKPQSGSERRRNP